MVYVPAGKFTFGDGSSAKEVNLGAFAIGRFEVTNAEYKAFLNATHYRGVPRYWKGGTFPEGKANHPVLFVSLVDAEAYCDWISKATGWKVTIPTSEQWEKAARGLPEVRLVVERESGGKGILEQNLTAWKQGGYREWVRRREAMELAGRFRQEWQMLEETEQKKSLPETLALWAAGRLVLATMDVRAAKGKERWWMLREMMGHVCKLRGVEQAEQWMKLQERRVEIARMKLESGTRKAKWGRR